MSSCRHKQGGAVLEAWLEEQLLEAKQVMLTSCVQAWSLQHNTGSNEWSDCLPDSVVGPLLVQEGSDSEPRGKGSYQAPQSKESTKQSAGGPSCGRHIIAGSSSDAAKLSTATQDPMHGRPAQTPLEVIFNSFNLPTRAPP